MSSNIAPKADAELIGQAMEAVGNGKLEDLFVRPNDRGRAFLNGLHRRDRAALENAARPKK